MNFKGWRNVFKRRPVRQKLNTCVFCHSLLCIGSDFVGPKGLNPQYLALEAHAVYEPRNIVPELYAWTTLILTLEPEASHYFRIHYRCLLHEIPVWIHYPWNLQVSRVDEKKDGEENMERTVNRVDPPPNTLVAWSSGRTSVFGRCTFAVLRSTCSWWVTTYVGKPSAIGQPTRPTQPFILPGSINE